MQIASCRSRRFIATAITLCSGAGLMGCTPGVGRVSVVSRLEALPGGDGGQRALTALDISGDGRIDSPDWRAFDAVAAAAHKALAAQHESTAVGAGLYHGPTPRAPAVFSLLRMRDGVLDVSGVPAPRLKELAIEAHWAAQQAREAAGVAVSGASRVFGGVLHSRIPGYERGIMDPRAVCAALQKMSAAPLGATHGAPAAVLDLDNTVWKGNVTTAFLATLVEHHMAHPQANPPLQKLLLEVPGIDAAQVAANGVTQNAALLLHYSTAPDVSRAQRIGPTATYFAIVGLLAGMTPAEAQRAAQITYDVGTQAYPPWKTRLFTDASGCGMGRILSLMRRRGVTVYLLSATLDFLAWKAGEYLHVPRDHILGSVVQIVDGHYTGKESDSTYYTKGAIVRQWLPAPPLFAFGDSPRSDFSMLQEAAGAGFMINPGPQFLERDQNEAGSRLVALCFAARCTTSAEK